MTGNRPRTTPEPWPEPPGCPSCGSANQPGTQSCWLCASLVSEPEVEAPEPTLDEIEPDPETKVMRPERHRPPDQPGDRSDPRRPQPVPAPALARLRGSRDWNDCPSPVGTTDDRLFSPGTTDHPASDSDDRHRWHRGLAGLVSSRSLHGRCHHAHPRADTVLQRWLLSKLGGRRSRLNVFDQTLLFCFTAAFTAGQLIFLLFAIATIANVYL